MKNKEYIQELTADFQKGLITKEDFVNKLDLLCIDIDKINKIIYNSLRELWIHLKGTEEGFDEWYKNSNKLNLN